MKIGYALVDRKPDRVHLKFAGRWFTTAGDAYRTSGPAMRGCSYCGKINLTAAPHCTCCGATA